jgi:hypothetical protein
VPRWPTGRACLMPASDPAASGPAFQGERSRGALPTRCVAIPVRGPHRGAHAAADLLDPGTSCSGGRARRRPGIPVRRAAVGLRPHPPTGDAGTVCGSADDDPAVSRRPRARAASRRWPALPPEEEALLRWPAAWVHPSSRASSLCSRRWRRAARRGAKRLRHCQAAGGEWLSRARSSRWRPIFSHLVGGRRRMWRRPAGGTCSSGMTDYPTLGPAGGGPAIAGCSRIGLGAGGAQRLSADPEMPVRAAAYVGRLLGTPVPLPPALDSRVGCRRAPGCRRPAGLGTPPAPPRATAAAVACARAGAGRRGPECRPHRPGARDPPGEWA